MQETIKRLKLIQTSIELDDTDIVEMQVDKLESLDVDEEVANILRHLKAMAYGKAQLAIETYLAKYSTVVAYEDPEVQGLKLELKALEKKLQELDALKAEQLHTIDEFNTQYSLRLGGIIEKILKLKAELLAKGSSKCSFKCSSKMQEEDEVNREYQEAKKDYEEFHREYEEVQKKTLFELNEAEKKELKKCFRKAARLCHPDTVSKELQEQAHEISAALNNAYAQQDLAKVKEILQMLENGVYFDLGSDTLDNSEKLKAKIAILRDKIIQTTQELESIEKDETFCLIQEIDDWESYFMQAKEALKEEYAKLMNTEESSSQKASTKDTDLSKKNKYWHTFFDLIKKMGDK